MPLIPLAISAFTSGLSAFLQFQKDNAAAIAAAKESDQALIVSLKAHLLANETEMNAADAEALAAQKTLAI